MNVKVFKVSGCSSLVSPCNVSAMTINPGNYAGLGRLTRATSVKMLTLSMNVILRCLTSKQLNCA